MRGLVTSLAIASVLLGAFVMPAQAAQAQLLFRNESSAYVYVFLVFGPRGPTAAKCLSPHSNYDYSIREGPTDITARFYAASQTGPSCSGSALYSSAYSYVWRTGIEFWTTGNDQASYRFYHN